MPGVDREKWLERKQLFLRRIAEDREIGYLDPGVEGVLNAINSREKSYTTSSCAGRVTVIDAEKPWVRDESSVVFKKHAHVTLDEIRVFLEKQPARMFWLQATGPILHIITYDLEEAALMLEAARRSGFKHSGIMSISDKGFLVELVSGAQVNVPLRTRSTILVSPEALEEIIIIANKVLDESRERLRRLEEEVRKLEEG